MTLPRIQCALLSVLLLGSIDYALADTSCQLNPPVISGCGDFSGMPAQVYGGQTVTVSIGPSGTGAPCNGNARSFGIPGANGTTWFVDGTPVPSTDINMTSIPLDANPHTVQVTMQGHYFSGVVCNDFAGLGLPGIWTTQHYFELDPAITASFTANVTFKSGTGPGVNAGDTITYAATAQNAVPIASWVMASDLPPETTLVPGSITGGGVLSGRTITWTTTLGGYSVTVDPQLPGRTQVATGVFVTATLPNGDTAFAQASAQVPVQQPSLLLEITPTTRTHGEVEPGETYTYTLTLSVPSGATGITLQDAIPQNTTLIGSATPAAQLSGNVLTWTFPAGTTQPTASFKVQLAQVPPPGAQFVVDNANASATAGGRTLTTAATNQLKIQSALTFSINPPPPPAKVAPGDPIDYTLTAAVTATATTITITDTIPLGTTLVNAHGGQVSGSTGGSTVTWTFQNTGAATAMLSVQVLALGDLPPGLTSIDDRGHVDATLPSGEVLTADAKNTLPLEKMKIDWQMPPRLSKDLEEVWGATTPYGLPSFSDVNPPAWRVMLFLTSGGAPVCPPGFSYSWQVNGQPLPDTGCQVNTTVPKLGVYDVKATELQNGSPTGVVVENSRVVVRDWLIVGLGDSNGSGEGNPPFVFPQCDRSLDSSQYRAAQYIEDNDPRSSVTFLFASCSGARTEHLWKDSYEGITTLLGQRQGLLLPPQIQQVEDRIGTRPVDLVIMSIGINDLAFAPLMKFCVGVETLVPVSGFPPVLPGVRCESAGVKILRAPDGSVSSYHYDRNSRTTLADATQALVDQLPAKYAALAPHLWPAPIFITEYPDPTRDQNGSFCSRGEGLFPNFYGSTWGWIYNAAVGLNEAVDHSGWTPVTGIPGDFFHYGYCSIISSDKEPTNSGDFVAISTAYFKNLPALQTNPAGAFHASFAGQTITLNHTLPAVCTALYGNPDCYGIPPAPAP